MITTQSILTLIVLNHSKLIVSLLLKQRKELEKCALHNFLFLEWSPNQLQLQWSPPPTLNKPRLTSVDSNNFSLSDTNSDMA